MWFQWHGWKQWDVEISKFHANIILTNVLYFVFVIETSWRVLSAYWLLYDWSIGRQVFMLMIVYPHFALTSALIVPHTLSISSASSKKLVNSSPPKLVELFEEKWMTLHRIAPKFTCCPSKTNSQWNRNCSIYFVIFGFQITKSQLTPRCLCEKQNLSNHHWYIFILWIICQVFFSTKFCAW